MTSVYFKSSNSLGFNPILQKFYEIICEIIFSKTVCGIFLIFCRSRFINNFFMKNKFSEPYKSPKVKHLEAHLFLKNFRIRFCRSNLHRSYKLEGFFFSKIFFFFQISFFRTPKTSHLDVKFLLKKCFTLFFKCDYLNL